MRETALTWFFQFPLALPQKVACHFLVFYTPLLLTLAALCEGFKGKRQQLQRRIADTAPILLKN